MFVLGAFMSLMSFAQQDEIDPRLYAKYDKEYLEKISVENPKLLEKMNFYLQKSWTITDMPDKPIHYEELRRLSDNSTNITLDEIKNFNPYLYNCKNELYSSTYYKIGNTGKLLIMRPLMDLDRMYKNYLKVKRLKK